MDSRMDTSLDPTNWNSIDTIETIDTDVMDLKTTLGYLRGHVTEAPNGKKIAKFLGVPYAQQPVKDLRFKPLQPLKLPLGSQEKPFEATKLGKSSIQNTKIRSSTVLPTGEDCIYLNIYAPVNKINEPTKAVFFHIHGGSFYFSSGSEPLCDLTNFAARHNVVAVSINYRLGLLGFLSLPPFIEDNLGLKDQQFALKWVNQHIKSFGGDPSRVTVYGFSAGAVAAHLHTLNEESSPLFEKVILCSAIAQSQNCISPNKQRSRVKWALGQLKCTMTVKSKIYDFLMKLDVEKFGLVPAQPRYILFRGPIPVNTFMKDKTNFLPLSRKPILAGVIAEEGNLFVYNKKIDEPNNRRPRKLLSELFSYTWFFQPLDEFRLELSKNNKKFRISRGKTTLSPYPIFCYFFDYNTTTRNDEILPVSTYKTTFGKFHGLDIMFFLNHCCKGSQTVPETNLTDIKVNTTVAEMVEMFLTQNVNNPKLAVSSGKKGVLSRITDKGRIEEKFDFKPKTKSLKTKAFFAFVATKMFPKKY